MEKILKDRLNHLKSDLKQLTTPKLSKIVSYEQELGLRIRIDEVKWLIEKYKKDEKS